MMTATVPEVLRGAAELIEIDQAPFGIAEAIGRAAAGDGAMLTPASIDAVKAYIGTSTSLHDWNYAPDRTQIEILAALRGAADAWEASMTATDELGEALHDLKVAVWDETFAPKLRALLGWIGKR